MPLLKDVIPTKLDGVLNTAFDKKHGTGVDHERHKR